MMMLTYFAVLVAVFGVNAADSVNNTATNFFTCHDENSLATLDSVTVEHCPNPKGLCTLVKGHAYKISLQFTPKKQVDKVSTVVKGILAGMLPVPYDVPQPDGCIDSGLVCPVPAGKTVTYETALPVKEIYPTIHLKVKWELVDELQQTLVCVIIPVQIKPNKETVHH